MTKREILIRKLIAKESRRIRSLGDKALLEMAIDNYICDNCPLCGDLCEEYPQPTCYESVKAWFYEGGSNGNNN